MIKNIKVDVIYYTIGKDFEMEFNLCGCAQMRLLTDEVETRLDFSKSLARSVNRSSIIISCGPLFGEKGLVSTVSKITGIEKSVINNKKYGIDSEDDIEILNGATPLVSSDGIFGGCIIENGSQVIILLSESKSLRKKIMKELIHPYITQWSYMANESVDAPIAPFENNGEINEAEEVEETEETTEQATETAEEPSESQEPAEETETPDSSTEETAPAVSPKETNLNDFILKEPEEESKSIKSVAERNLEYYNYDTDDDYEENSSYFIDDYEAESKSKKSPAIILFTILTIVLALLIVFFAIIRPLVLGYDIMAYLKDIFTPSSDKLIKFFF